MLLACYINRSAPTLAHALPCAPLALRKVVQALPQAQTLQGAVARTVLRDWHRAKDARVDAVSGAARGDSVRGDASAADRRICRALEFKTQCGKKFLRSQAPGAQLDAGGGRLCVTRQCCQHSNYSAFT